MSDQEMAELFAQGVALKQELPEAYQKLIKMGHFQYDGSDTEEVEGLLRRSDIFLEKVWELVDELPEDSFALDAFHELEGEVALALNKLRFRLDSKSAFEWAEIYNLDQSFLDFIVPRLEAFIKMERHGYAPFLDDEYSECDTEEKKMAKWEEILWTIHDGLALRQQDPDDMASQTIEQSQEREKKFQRAAELFGRYCRYLWD